MGIFMFFTVCILVLILCGYKIMQWNQAMRRRRKLKKGMVSLLSQNIRWTSLAIVVGALGGILSMYILQYLVLDNEWIEIAIGLLSCYLFAYFVLLMFRKTGYKCPYCHTKFSSTTKFDVVDNEFICPICHNKSSD